ncbi:dioxygenase [Trinickia sp. YCB016]
MSKMTQDGSIVTDAESVTRIVQSTMSGGSNARLAAVMSALVTHVHAFLREVRLTDEEFEQGLDFIRQVGLTCTDSHNEVVLLSDVLGFSTLVKVLNNSLHEESTGGALLGPFYRAGSPHYEMGASIARAPTPGRTLYVTGRVQDTRGEPIPHAKVDVWQASPVGLYENQDPEQPEMNLRGHFFTDQSGSFNFKSIRPAGYPVPTHGPVGVLLREQKRHPYRPAHLHFVVIADGFSTLISQIFADDAEHLNSDVVFGVTRDLVGRFEPHDAGTGPYPDEPERYFTLNCEFILPKGVATLPTPPIK